MQTDHVISLIAGTRELAYRFINQELRRRGLRGLAPSHGAILSTLYAIGSLSMQELAQRIDRDKSTVTTLVGKLVDHGYVARSADPDDNRLVLIRLTRKGRALQPVFTEISRDLMRTAYLGFGRREKETLVRSLDRMQQNFARRAIVRDG